MTTAMLNHDRSQDYLLNDTSVAVVRADLGHKRFVELSCSHKDVVTTALPRKYFQLSNAPLRGVSATALGLVLAFVLFSFCIV